MSAKITLQPAYVLHSKPYRDTSLLLDVSTAEYGRIGLVARGGRSPKSRLRGLLQPFRSLLLSWSGKGELYTLSGAEEVNPQRRLPNDRLLSGLYINELVMRLTQRNDPHTRLFSVYSRTLRDLSEADNIERCLRIFEKSLLEDLGYGLLLDQEAEQAVPVKADRLYRYQLERGPVHADESTPAGIPIHGHSLLSLSAEELSDAVSLAETKRLMRAVLAYYLGGRPLKSREMISGSR